MLLYLHLPMGIQLGMHISISRAGHTHKTPFQNYYVIMQIMVH